SAASRAEMTKPQLHITTTHQFPPFLPELPVSEQRKDLYAGLGVVVFDGPQGRGFYKGGHDGQTANTTVCIEASQRCVLILSKDDSGNFCCLRGHRNANQCGRATHEEDHDP